MAVYRASGSFNCGSASPGLQTCVDPEHGSFRPKLIWLLPLYTGSANNCYWHRGFVAEDAEQNLTQWALGIRSGDNQSSAAVRTARYTDRAWVQVISSGIGCDGTVAIGDTGFTPSVSTTNGTVDVHWVALGGDVEEAVCVAVEITSGDADGTVPVEVGFAPDVVIAATSAVSAINNTDENSNSSACFGWATRADTAGVSYAQRRVRGADPTTNWSSSDAVLFQSLTSTVGWTATVGAWNADGVDLSITGTPGLSSQWLYMVLARGGEWRTVTATGDGEATQLVPVTGVDPVAVMAQSWGRAPSGSVIDGDILSSFGIAAAGGQASEWGSDADAVGTTQADGTYTTDSLIYIGTVNAPATIQAEAAVDSFGTEALNLAWNPVDSVGRELQFLLVGDAASAEVELSADGPVGQVGGTADLSVGAPAVELAAAGAVGSQGGSAALTVPHQVYLSGGLVMGGTVIAQYGLPLAASGAVGSEAGTADLTSTLPLAAAGAIGSQAGDAALTVELALAAAGVVGAVDGEAALTSDLPLAAAAAVGALAGSAALTAGVGEVALAASGSIGQVGGHAALSSALGLAASGAVGAMAGGAHVTTDLPLVAAGAMAAFGGTADISSGLTLAAAGTIGQFAGTATVTTTLDLQAAGTVGAVAGAAALSVEEAVLALAAAGAVGVFGGTARVTSTIPLVAQGALWAVAGSADLSVAAQVGAILLGGPITQRRITVGPITQRGQQAS